MAIKVERAGHGLKIEAPFEVMQRVFEIPLWVEAQRLEALEVLNFELCVQGKMFRLTCAVKEFTQVEFAERVVTLFLNRYETAKANHNYSWMLFATDPEFWSKELFPAHAAPILKYFQDEYNRRVEHSKAWDEKWEQMLKDQNLP